MYLNVDKCFVISFHRKLQPLTFDYFINGHKLSRVTYAKDLGVQFQSNLKFNAHIQDIANRAYRNLGFVIRNSRDFKNPATFRSLYCSLVRPVMEYCSVLWSPYYQFLNDSLERVQKKFLKALSYKDLSMRESSYEQIMAKYKIIPLKNRRDMADILFLFKILIGKIQCLDIYQSIQFRENRYNIRNKDIFKLNTYSNNETKNCPMNRAMKLINTLSNPPYNINFETESLVSLKNKLHMLFGELIDSGRSLDPLAYS
ncbi:hypothetical protein WDU94_012337 [Cyamophila willieti]